MMKQFISFVLVLLGSFNVFSGNADKEFPDSVFSGYQGKFHVQGIAVDVSRGRVFFSFTTRLLVTDFKGNAIGSVDGLTGHLGCLAYDYSSNLLYGSIEYKNDAIGTGIAGEAAKSRESKFYIAIFNPEKINRMSMNQDDVMELAELPEVAGDYHAIVVNRGKEVEHRYGCSGIDGIALAPQPGNKKGKRMLYVAYGIYGDTTRSDNDYQVVNCYDTKKFKLRNRYFVFTGNTTFGIQNLCYNPVDNTLLAAVYKGYKKDFPNYTLFAIDLGKKARKEKLKGFDNTEEQLVLPLDDAGLKDGKTGIRGWNIPFGSTGICWLKGDLFYISHHSSRPEQSSTIFLYKWTGSEQNPFEMVK